MGVYMDEIRQSPEHFLKEIEKEKQNLNRGHLKIFFGYAAGVGKTYAMLKAAHSVKRHGIDVVAGYIEPHARLQTSALVNGLECLPNLVSEYNGITLSEFNLDAALARHPQLILVDELAHTYVFSPNAKTSDSLIYYRLFISILLFRVFPNY